MNDNTIAPKTLNVPILSSVDQLSQQPANPIDCANWPEFPDGPETSFQIGIIDNAIALRFTINEANPRAVNTHDLEPVWQDSAVEFFCQVPGARKYYNFEFNSRGVCIASSRAAQNEDVVYFSPEELAQIVRIPDVKADHWTLTVIIPLSLIKDAEGAEALKCNFYKCGDETAHPHYLSWSPIVSDQPAFHRPQYFGAMKLFSEE